MTQTNLENMPRRYMLKNAIDEKWIEQAKPWIQSGVVVSTDWGEVKMREKKNIKGVLVDDEMF